MKRGLAILLGTALTTVPHSAVLGYRPDPAARPELASVPASPVPLGADEDAAGLARIANARRPLTGGIITPARPFYLEASLEDRARATDCLAAADFYEAGGDPDDQRAVAQVVLNRVRHIAFPATVCGVVFQGSERRTGCQFTFACDGSLARRRPSPAAWGEARKVAAEMLVGRIDSVVGWATHYHTDWVAPLWDRSMDKLAVIKSHLFFRWRGAEGSPAAFVKGYAGGEPRIARLAGLSPAHGDGKIEADAAAGFTTPSPAPPIASGPIASGPPALGPAGPVPSAKMITGSVPDVFLVALPRDASPASFARLAEQKCAGLGACRFIGWTDPDRRAQSLPMAGTSVDAISFTFVRSEGEKVGHAHWNCAQFTRSDPNECLPRAQ